MIVAHDEIILKGIPISKGIAIGRPYFFAQEDHVVPEFTIEPHQIEEEVARYQLAVSLSCEEIKAIHSRLQNDKVFDGTAILEAHLQILQDPLLTMQVEDQIRQRRTNAEIVFQNVISGYQKKFNAIEDPFFRDRFKDIKDISRRILDHLRSKIKVSFNEIPDNSIIFALDIASFDVAGAQGVAGFVTQEGGLASHAAIVAKAKGIPYVSGVALDKLTMSKDSMVILDGRTGHIILNPTKETLQCYSQLKNQLSVFHSFVSNNTLEPETYDGYRIQLSANVEMISEVDSLKQMGGIGVGLFRTESVFLSKNTFPSEKEQFAVYRTFVEKMEGRSIVIRIFDLGGDKFLGNVPYGKEANPFLGCRALRFLLKEKKLFKMQLRAILRASAYGDVSILFPMVSTLSELREAKSLLYECREELIQEGVEIAGSLPMGCMIEVPSAAMIADILAKECDFLSIGTNDLVQYSLAVDRTNRSLEYLYTPSHPSVVRLIKLVVSEANMHGIPVTMCGEMAADPRFTHLLLGLGVHELSVAARTIPIIKNAIRSTSIIEASKLAEKALQLTTPEEIEKLITDEYRRCVPEDCIHNY